MNRHHRVQRIRLNTSSPSLYQVALRHLKEWWEMGGWLGWACKNLGEKFPVFYSTNAGSYGIGLVPNAAWVFHPRTLAVHSVLRCQQLTLATNIQSIQTHAHVQKGNPAMKLCFMGWSTVLDKLVVENQPPKASTMAMGPWGARPWTHTRL